MGNSSRFDTVAVDVMAAGPIFDLADLEFLTEMEIHEDSQSDSYADDDMADLADDYYMGQWRIIRSKQNNSKELENILMQCQNYRPSTNPEHLKVIFSLSKVFPNWPKSICVLLCDYVFEPMLPYMKGVKHNIPVNLLKNWTIHYFQPYIHRTQFEDIQPPPGDDYTYVFWGAKNVDEDVFHIGCVGRISEVYNLQNTDVFDFWRPRTLAYPHNDAYWYCSPGYSCGFSSDPNVFLRYADASEAQTGRAFPNPEDRLSWNLDNGTSTGGYRAGKHLDLGSDSTGFLWWKCVAFL